MRRKTRIALLLSVLTAVAAFAAAGIAQTRADVPAWMALAPQMAGDAGEYRFATLDGDDETDPHEQVLRFRWLPTEAVRDAHGRLRLTNPLVVETERADERVSTTRFVDAEDRSGLVAQVSGDAEFEETVLVPLIPSLGTSTSTRATERVTLPDPAEQRLTDVACGLLPAQSGERVALRSRLPLLMPCSPPGREGDDRVDFLFEPSFRAVSTERVGTRDAVVFQGVGKAKGTWVWLDADIPYPLQVTQEGSHGRTHVLRLASFERGTAPFAAAPAQDDVLAPIALAPRLPWGMDDAGVTHPFPLSAAWMRARDDPLASGMRDWLADHPDAYTARARGRVVQYGDDLSHEWKWVLADGVDQLTVGLTRTEPVLPGPVPDGVLALVPQETLMRYSYDNATFFDDSETYAPVQLIDPALPTVRSLEAHWRGHGGGSRPLESWSFHTVCFQNTCQAQSAEQSVGAYRFTGEAVGGGPLTIVSGWDLDLDLLLRSDPKLVDADVAPSLSIWRIERDDSQLEVAGIPVNGDAEQPPQALVIAGVWTLPGTMAIATVGGLALAIFLAVRFGGALLGMPLFSRIQGNDLLEHPLRRTLHQAIEANPGIHLKALARTVARPRNTVEHHVRKLVAGGLVTQHELNGYACLFVKGTVDRREQAAAGALKSEAARRVLAAVVRSPGASGRDIAMQAGLTATLVSYHVQNLQKAGLLEGQREGRFLRLLPTELGRKSSA